MARRIAAPLLLALTLGAGVSACGSSGGYYYGASTAPYYDVYGPNYYGAPYYYPYGYGVGPRVYYRPPVHGSYRGPHVYGHYRPAQGPAAFHGPVYRVPAPGPRASVGHAAPHASGFHGGRGMRR